MSQWVLSVLLWIFSLWMVSDAIFRRKSLIWVAVIVLLHPFGALGYLVWVKVLEPRRARQLPGGAAPPLTGPSSAASTRAHEPSLKLADQLEEQGRYEQAGVIYRSVEERAPGNCRALHGLARCLLELQQPAEALEKYEALMAIDPRFRNYSAALEYAEGLHQVGRHADATDLLEGLVQETGRLNHRLALAHYWEAAGDTARARSVLTDALAAYESSPPREREANREWQRRIADKLQELAAN